MPDSQNTPPPPPPPSPPNQPKSTCLQVGHVEALQLVVLAGLLPRLLEGGDHAARPERRGVRVDVARELVVPDLVLVVRGGGGWC